MSMYIHSMYLSLCVSALYLPFTLCVCVCPCTCICTSARVGIPSPAVPAPGHSITSRSW